MKKLIFIIGLFLTLIASAETYYVKTGGNDASAGTADGSAWAHHPWMSTWTGSVTLQPGDSVLLNRGDTWTISGATAPYMEIAQSGISGKPILTSAYGTGAKPIIKIAADNDYPVISGLGVSYISFDNLDIQHFESARHSGNQQYGIKIGYNAVDSVPHDWVITNCNIHNIPNIAIMGADDSYNIIIGDINAIAVATSVSYSNHIYDCGYGGVILCGRDSVTDRSDWSVYYNYIHDIDITATSNRDAYGIAFTSDYNNGTGQGFSDGWPVYATARYNRVENVPGHGGIDTHGGTYIYFQDNYVYNCLHSITVQAASRVNQEEATLNHIYVERNIIENIASPVVANAYFIVAVSESNLLRGKNIFINNNTLYYTTRPANETTAIAILMYSVDSVNVIGNNIYNGPVGHAGSGIRIASGVDKDAKYITVKNNHINNWDEGIYIFTDDLDGDVFIYNNIIKSPYRAFVARTGTLISGCDISVYNNTFVVDPLGSPYYGIDFDGTGDVTIAEGASITVRNNIIAFSSVISGIYVNGPAVITGTFTCNYNLYFNSNAASPYYRDGSSHSFSSWQAHGHDANGLNNTDPLLRNFTGSYSDDNDFDIKPLSPARDAGIDVGLTGDYFGLKYGGNPSIGAIDYHKRLILIR